MGQPPTTDSVGSPAHTTRPRCQCVLIDDGTQCLVRVEVEREPRVGEEEVEPPEVEHVVAADRLGERLERERVRDRVEQPDLVQEGKRFTTVTSSSCGGGDGATRSSVRATSSREGVEPPPDLQQHTHSHTHTHQQQKNGVVAVDVAVAVDVDVAVVVVVVVVVFGQNDIDMRSRPSIDGCVSDIDQRSEQEDGQDLDHVLCCSSEG